jgi:dsDNA-specific endonuclease/ATPase MutS2
MVDAGAISIPVSAGELIDKIMILEIKAERFSDAEKLRRVRHELDMLRTVRDAALPPSPALDDLTEGLRVVNRELWRIEDAIRLCEQRQDFGPKFVELARSVYRNNDRRSELKRRISELAGSSIVEEKAYTPYTR